MKGTSIAVLITAALVSHPPRVGTAQELAGNAAAQLETRIWLDRGVDPVLQPGDRARVYYRASNDAYLLLVHIDTDGVLKLLFPGGSQEAPRARGSRDYRLLFPDSDQWLVDEAPGVGYFFVLASDGPFDLHRLNEVPVAGGWDSSPEGNRISGDPFVTVDDFRRVLLSNRDPAAWAVDFIAYHVEQPYSYPRFVCNQCHTAQTFEQWNPYLQTCLDVRVVIYNDPYYYPATRYRGGRVVYARPPRPGLPQFVFRPRQLGEAGTPLVQGRAAARDGTDVPLGPGRLPPQTTPDHLLRSVDQQLPSQDAPGASRLGAPSGLLPQGPGPDDRARPTLRRR